MSEHSTEYDQHACSKHRSEGHQEDCNLCVIEKKAVAIAERWLSGAEGIPPMASSRALEILEWTIIRQALSTNTMDGDWNRELALIRKLLAVLALRAGNIEQLFLDYFADKEEVGNE